MKIYRKVNAVSEQTVTTVAKAEATAPNSGVKINSNKWNDPATPKQLWALFKLTGKDHRQMKLTKKAASDLIGPLMQKLAEKKAAKAQVSQPAQEQTEPPKESATTRKMPSRK